MPTEERVGLEDEEFLFPVLDATGQEDEPEPIRLGEDRLFDLAVKNDELLTEEGIFGDEVGFSAWQVGDRAENYRMVGRLGEMQKDMFKERNETSKQ